MTQYTRLNRVRSWTALMTQPGKPDRTLTGVRKISAISEITYGVNRDDWRRRIALGMDATTEAQGVAYRVPKLKPVVSYGLNIYDQKYAAAGYLDSGNIPEFLGPIYTPSTEAVTMAEMNFAKSYRKRTQQATTGVTLGELTEAARLLANPVKSLYGLTRTLADDVKRAKRLFSRRKDGGQMDRHDRKRKGRKRTAYTDALAKSWLAYQFGARPLASEANSFMQAVRQLDSGRTFDLIRVFGSGHSEKDLGTVIGTASFTGTPATVMQEIRRTERCEVRIRGAIKVRGEIPPLQTFGLSALDIVPTAWELIPFSFLVDYFTNAGDSLDACMLRFVDFAWLNQSVRNRRMVQAAAVRPSKHVDYIYRIAYGGDARFTTTTIQRAPRANNFGGGLSFTAPGLGSLKWLNMAALTKTIAASRP